MKLKLNHFFGTYYFLFLILLFFITSLSLWFYGYKLEGIFVGVWVFLILSSIRWFISDNKITIYKNHLNDTQSQTKRLTYKNKRKI